MDKWSFVYEGFEPEQESLREALCTLGNGYFATRGAAPEAEADGVHYPGTYLAGGYNRLSTEIEGRTIENEDLVNLPNWLPLTFRIEGGDWFDFRKVETVSYRQELDLKQGRLIRTVRFRDSEDRLTTLTSRRFLHIRSQHLAGIETTLIPENWSGRLDVRSALDGRVVNAGVKRYRRLNSKHLDALEAGAAGEDGVWLKVRTNQSRIEIAVAARTRLFLDGEVVAADRSTVRDPGYVAQEFACDVTAGSTVTIEKIVSLFTSRDRGISESGLEARTAIERADGFDQLLESHILAWQHLWEHFDIDLTNSGQTTLILRLHIFHLLQTVSVHTIDLDVGVPARGWHGEAYRGHIFWDELFIFPLLNFRLPELTRALLCYRHRRLPEARWAAKEAGYRGAMYPWQGGSNGREESQKLHLNPQSGHWMPDNSYLQRHINAAIAYMIWEYYRVTADTEFLYYYGAEMLLEIARFWASIATYNTELDRYEILHVMGPDEYHDSYPDADEPGVNNNAYTNIMAAWVLCRALEVLDILPGQRRRELCETLHLEREEIERWEDVSRKMRVVFHDDRILYMGSGNPLSHVDTAEIMDRWNSKDVFNAHAEQVRLKDLLSMWDDPDDIAMRTCPRHSSPLPLLVVAPVTYQDYDPMFWACSSWPDSGCGYKRKFSYGPRRSGARVCDKCGTSMRLERKPSGERWICGQCRSWRKVQEGEGVPPPTSEPHPPAIPAEAGTRRPSTRPVPRTERAGVSVDTEAELASGNGDSLLAQLLSSGLKVIDRRRAGGALWVIGGQEVAELLAQYGFKFAHRGSRATGRRPAWYL